MNDTPMYDPDRICEKCGFDRIDDLTTFHSWRTRIVRTCLRCKNVWEELPLDHDQEAEDRAAKEYFEHTRRIWGVPQPPPAHPPILVAHGVRERVDAAWDHVKGEAA